MRLHQTDTYLDDHKVVLFCKVCSKEGQELIGTECVGKFEQKSDIDVDKNDTKD